MLTKLLPIAALLLLFTNCGKNDEEVLFTIPYQLNFSTPAGLNTLETHYYEINNIPSRIDSVLVARGISKEDITSVSPKSAELSSLFADGEYGFIREVSVDIFETGSTYYQEVYFHPQVPQNTGSTLDLAGTLVDAKERVTSEKFNIRVGLMLRNFAPQSMENTLRFTFAIK